MNRRKIHNVIMTRKWLLFSAVLFIITRAAIGQTTDNSRVLSQKLDEYLNSAVSVYKFNGSVLIARKGRIILQKGYGYNNYANQTLNDTNSIFRSGH